MAEAIKGSSIENEMFEAFKLFLKVSHPHSTIASGVLCGDKAKFSLVCYMSNTLKEEQVKYITGYLNDILKSYNFNKEWEDFYVKMIKLSKTIPVINCYIFETKGGKENFAKKLQK